LTSPPFTDNIHTEWGFYDGQVSPTLLPMKLFRKRKFETTLLIKIDPEIKRAFKARVAMNGDVMSEVVREAIHNYLQ
jgi:hypothetical protein